MTVLSLDRARDTAQQVVTALLHGDRHLAGQIVEEYPAPLILALVLADLVAHTHHSWARATGMAIEQRNQSWAELMADIEEWRSEQGASS